MIAAGGTAVSTPPPPRRAPPGVDAGGPPRGLRGLLALLYLTIGRAACTATAVVLVFAGAPLLALLLGAPRVLTLFSVLVMLPVGLLAPPVIGVLQGQRLPPDYRQLGAGLQFGLWLRGPRVRTWPLPLGSLADAELRRQHRAIAARAGRIAPLARGARAALAAEISAALRGVHESATAEQLIDEAIARVTRWEAEAAGLPPVGAKLYLRHDPLSDRAESARRAAARLGVPSDHLNYFWRGQVLLLPPARSHRTLARVIDALLDAGVARPGAPLPLQITVQGALGDAAKLIALTQLLASGLDMRVEGPERRGDEGNLIARGRLAPEPVAGPAGRDRTDFLYSLVWTPMPAIAAAGYADQHHRDLRVTQTLAAALLARRHGSGLPRGTEQRLAAAWQEYADALMRLCAAWGVEEAVVMEYLDVPFADVRPAIERLLARKAEEPDLQQAARHLRDRALALVEFTLVVHRLHTAERLRRLRLFTPGAEDDQEYPLRAGMRRVRRAVRAGRGVALIVRDGPTARVLLTDGMHDHPAPTQR